MVGAGILLGIAVGLELLGAGFPYGIAAAPCLWLARGCLALFPTYAAAKLGWILVVSLGAYGGAVGAALHAPLRRWPLLLLLAQLHVVAGFALGRFGL